VCCATAQAVLAVILGRSFLRVQLVQTKGDVLSIPSHQLTANPLASHAVTCTHQNFVESGSGTMGPGLWKDQPHGDVMEQIAELKQLFRTLFLDFVRWVRELQRTSCF
jgi:hypothetical protein